MIRFDNFSSNSFEHFIQSLAVRVFGPGTVVFGTGRDGGREATYDGKFPGFSGKEWNGYTVVQAKFHEKLTGDKRDAAWLARQLTTELEKFRDNPDLRTPDFYLICSNVELSSIPDIGGKALIESVFDNFSTDVPIRGWHVWAGDELRTLLDQAPEIRASYLAWITPSDIMAMLVEKLKEPDLRKIIPVLLAKELRDERDARLRDAGQETSKAISLETIFVDLPVDLPFAVTAPTDQVDFSSIEADEFDAVGVDDYGDEDRSDACLNELMRLAADVLNPAAVTAKRKETGRPMQNRVVILGGPGQGKSTIGQFLAQIARSRFLLNLDEALVNPDISEIAGLILSSAGASGIRMSGPLRLPFRVDLPAFADAVAVNPALEILGYLCQRLASGGEQFSIESFRNLFKEMPSIIIFDGLDEVPPSANRIEVIRKIEGFWDEIHHLGADVLGIVTTRPQGYDHDLNPRFWMHWVLKPLPPSVALLYAKRLAEIRVSEPDRKALLIEDIHKACLDPTTKLLTTSPLQVAILFGISLLKGNIPQDRWELFDRYYSLLRDREAQKPGPVSKFIRTHKRLIDAIHQRCGWLLQARAEVAGRMNSFLSDEQFRQIILDLLKDEEFDSDDAQAITEELARIATQRLVMLATRVDGQIAFDVRSLQEYAAAALLTSGDQQTLDDRLRAISTSSHWRHVFRIAASRIFSVADMGRLRGMVMAICDALDAGDIDPDAKRVKSGAFLALDLLTDRVAYNAPKFQRQLISRALQILEIGSPAYDTRLEIIREIPLSDFPKEDLAKKLHSPDRSVTRSTLRLLLIASDRQPAAMELALQVLGWEDELVLKLLQVQDVKTLPKAFKDRLISAQRNVGELAALEFGTRFSFNSSPEDHEAREEFQLLKNMFRPRRPRRSRSNGFGASFLPGVSIEIKSLDSPRSFLESIPADLDPRKWKALRAIKGFAMDPGASRLADTIEALSDCPRKLLSTYEGRLGLISWPLGSAMRDIKEGATLENVVKRAADRDYGDVSDWRQAEARWTNTGVLPDDLLSWSSGYYIDRGIAERGVPCFQNYSFAHNHAYADLADLLKIIPNVAAAPKRERLIWFVANLIDEDVPNDDELAIEVANLFFQLPECQESLSPRLRLLQLGSRVWADHRTIEFADRFGRSTFNIPANDGAGMDALKAFKQNNERRGLLAFVANLTSQLDEDILHEVLASLPEEAFRFQEGDTAAIATSATILSIWNKTLSAGQITNIFKWFSQAEKVAFLSQFNRSSRRFRGAFSLGRNILSEIANLYVEVDEPLTGSVFDLTRKMVSGELTNLHTTSVANNYSLPSFATV